MATTAEVARVFEDAGGANLAGASTASGKILKYFFELAVDDQTTGYTGIEQTGPNRITVVYDNLPDERNPIGTVYAHPGRVYLVDIDVSFT